VTGDPCRRIEQVRDPTARSDGLAILAAARVIYGQEFGPDPNNGSLSGLAIFVAPMFALMLASPVLAVEPAAAASVFRRTDKSG
jgi:hypothetical protein